MTMALPSRPYGPSIEPTVAVKLAFSAVTDRPVLASLKIKVPSLQTSAPADGGLDAFAAEG